MPSKQESIAKSSQPEAIFESWLFYGHTVDFNMSNSKCLLDSLARILSLGKLDDGELY